MCHPGSVYQRWVMTVRSHQHRHICVCSRWSPPRRVHSCRRTFCHCPNFPPRKNSLDSTRQSVSRLSAASRRSGDWSRNSADVARSSNWQTPHRKNWRHQRQRRHFIGEQRPRRRWSSTRRRWKCCPVGSRIRRRVTTTPRIQWSSRWTSFVATSDKHRRQGAGMRWACSRKTFANCSRNTGHTPRHNMTLKPTSDDQWSWPIFGRGLVSKDNRLMKSLNHDTCHLSHHDSDNKKMADDKDADTFMLLSFWLQNNKKWTIWVYRWFLDR